MRTLWWCLPFFSCAVGVPSADAQGMRPRFAIGLGRSFPSGAFRSDTTGEGFVAGWVLTGHSTLRPLAQVRRLLLRIDATYQRNRANDRLQADLESTFGQSSDERMTLLGVNASVELLLAPAARFSPTAFGGLGLWHSTVTLTTGFASTHTSATKLAWQLGAEVTRGVLFLELRYVSVSAAPGYPGTSFFPVTIGFTFGKAAR